MMDNSHMHREDSNARLNSNNSLRPSGANSSGGCTYDDGKSNEESGHLFGVHPTSQDVWDQGVGYLKNLATSSVPEAKLAHNQQPGSVAPWKVGPNISVASECHRLFSSASDITASQDQLQMIFMHPGSRAPDKNAFQPNLHPFLSETTKTQHYNALYIDHLPSELLTCSRGNQFDLDKINSQKTNQSNGVKLQAVKKQNFDEIYRLLDKGVHMNSTEDECTALQASAAAGDAAAIEHLLACRADPGKRDHYERTAEYYSNPKGVSFTTLMPTSNSRTRILAPTTIEWEKSYRGESTNAYFTDVQQPMQTLPQGHQGKHFLPTIETPLLERNRITCDYSSSLSRPKVKEGESNKSYPDIGPRVTVNGSKTLPHLREQETTGSYPKVCETYHQPQRNYGLHQSPELRKHTLFSIDSITRPAASLPSYTKISSSETVSNPAYGLHPSARRPDPNSIPLAIEPSSISSSFSSDSYDVTNQLAGSINLPYNKTPSPSFQYYNVYSNPELAFSLPNMMYPLCAPLGMPGFVGNAELLKTQHEQLLQLPTYNPKSHVHAGSEDNNLTAYLPTTVHQSPCYTDLESKELKDSNQLRKELPYSLQCRKENLDINSQPHDPTNSSYFSTDTQSIPTSTNYNLYQSLPAVECEYQSQLRNDSCVAMAKDKLDKHERTLDNPIKLKDSVISNVSAEETVSSPLTGTRAQMSLNSKIHIGVSCENVVTARFQHKNEGSSWLSEIYVSSHKESLGESTKDKTSITTNPESSKTQSQCKNSRKEDELVTGDALYSNLTDAVTSSIENNFIQKEKRGRKRALPESKKAHLKRESSTLPRILSSEKKTSTQRAKRPRKSETDKKPHGWEHQGFSSTDPEKDDSRDEDFSCPATVNIHSWSDRPSSLRSCSSGQLTLTDSFNDSIFECDVSSLQSKAKKLGPLKRSGSSKSGKVGPGMRRKQKRSRKLSSDSASSSACREKSSNILSDLKDNRKRLKRGKLSLNCGERTNLTKKKQQKVKRKKKALKFHSFEENDVKKHCEQSRNKDKIKGTQIEQNRNALVTTDNKQDRKKKKKIKKEKPNDSEATNQTVPIFSTLKSNDYPIARGKRDSANIPEPSPKLVCPLIELYTGKSAERSSTLTGMNIGEPLISSTGVNVTGVENALFGHDLTACEARVLHDAYVRQDPLMNRTRTLEHSVEGNVPSASSDKCSDKKSFPIQYGKKGKEKGKKKCGRRPKSQLLQTVSCASVPSHLLRKKDEVLRLSDGKAKKCMRHHNKDKRNNKGSKAIGNKLNYSNNAKTGRPSGPIKKKKMRAMSCKNTKPIKPTDKKLETPIFLHSGRATATKSPKFFNTPSKSFHYHGSSRSSTPLSLVKEGGTPHILPPNVKKLTANSAIGETRLHKAARHGYLENIEYYLEMGFEVNTKTNAGYTALHEACVRGRLEAAKRLLQYGADVNVHSNDGTRPIHDAVEHDHVEMTRLLLACGADPMLTKFCGRSIQNMVHSEEMATFISALIKELKPVDENSKDDPDRLWTFEASAVLDKKLKLGCDNLNFPPLDDNQFSHMDLELYETPPPDTYFVQPSDTSNRTNYCLLSDVLKMKKCSRADFLLKHPVDIKTMPLKEFHLQFSNNWVPKVCGGCPDVSGKYVELITANKSVAEATLLRVTDEGEVLTLQTDRALKKPRQVSHRSFIEELLTSNSSKNCMESMANLVDIAHCSNSSFRPITCGNSLCEKKSPLTAEETSASIRSPYKREITADISYHVDTKTLQDSFNKNTDSVKFTENFIVNDTITSNHIASAGLLLPSEKLNLHERDDISDKRSSCSDETAELHTTRERVLLREEHDSKSTSPVSKTEKAIFRFAEPGVIRNGEIFNNGRVKSDCKETKSCKKITMRNNESFSLLKNISDKVRQQQKYNCVAEMADGDRAIL